MADIRSVFQCVVDQADHAGPESLSRLPQQANPGSHFLDVILYELVMDRSLGESITSFLSLENVGLDSVGKQDSGQV